MNYLRNHLLNRESLLLETELHWVMFIAPAIYSIALIFFIIYQPRNTPRLVELVGAAVVIGLWLNQLLQYLTTEFAISQNRVAMKQGFFFIRTIDILINRIASVQLQQTLWGKVLGYGDVVITGTSGEQWAFRQIANVTVFYQRVLAQQAQA